MAVTVVIIYSGRKLNVVERRSRRNDNDAVALQFIKEFSEGGKGAWHLTCSNSRGYQLQSRIHLATTEAKTSFTIGRRGQSLFTCCRSSFRRAWRSY